MAYCSLTEVVEELDLTGNDDYILLSRYITQAQKAIDNYTRRTFEGTAGNRLFDAMQDVEGSVLWVYSAGDLASITSITNGNGDSVAASAYVTEPRNAVARGKPIRGIRLKMNTSTWWRTASNGVSEDAITVNGIWAYSATAPADIKGVCVEMAVLFYRLKDTTSDYGRTIVTPGGTVLPVGLSEWSRRILNSYRRGI